jgi:hypothetical protein
MQRPPTIPQCMYQTNIHKKIYWWKLNPYRIYKYICISYIAQEKFEDTNDVIRILGVCFVCINVPLECISFNIFCFLWTSLQSNGHLSEQTKLNMLCNVTFCFLEHF